MDKKEIEKMVKRKQLEETLAAEDASTFNDRVMRQVELEFTNMIANTHFAETTIECIKLYRDGRYFACIALCQAVAEALARFMCESSQFPSVDKDFEKNVATLKKRKIEPDCNELLLEIWEGRHDYHHLNPNIEADKGELKEIAKSKLVALHKVESEVFAYSIAENGGADFKYPKYWSIENGFADVYLRMQI